MIVRCAHTHLLSICTQAGSAAGSAILGLLGIVVQDLNLLLGLNCSPITVLGGAFGGDCSAEAVCCQDNSYVCIGSACDQPLSLTYVHLQGGLISVGCVPFTL